MKKLKDNIVEWIRNWFSENGDENTKAIIGISGGKDSTIVAALCCEALGEARVVGILMPCGEQFDIKDSYDVVNYLNIESYEVNIGKMYETTVNEISNQLHIKNKLVLGNTQARLRMTTLYAISQELGGRVSNNCNASERFVGYMTIYGDDTGDFSPLSDLTVTEVKSIGSELGLPEYLWNKTPIDGLNNNMIDNEYLTDEQAMGFTYVQLDEYILKGFIDDKEASKLIESKHKLSEFKRNKGRIPHYKK